MNENAIKPASHKVILHVVICLSVVVFVAFEDLVSCMYSQSMNSVLKNLTVIVKCNWMYFFFYQLWNCSFFNSDKCHD